MAQGTSVASIVRFNAWMENLGEQKAGLPAGSLLPLHRSGIGLESRAMGLRNNLFQMRESWQLVRQPRAGSGVDSATAIKNIIRNIVAELNNLQITTRSMLQDAGTMKVQMADAMTLVQSQILADEMKLKQLALDLGKASMHLEQERHSLEETKTALDGWSGFWKGVAMVLSFGGYKPIQENLNKANNAIAAAYRVVNELSAIRNQQTRFQGMQRECKALLENLGGTDVALAALQNGLNTALATMSNAHKDESRFLNATTDEVAAYYFNAGARDMDRLFAWMDAFFGQGGLPVVAATGVLPGILGSFECHAYDNNPKQKNDWHYVTISKVGDLSAIWTNRAGVSWVLHVTPDQNVLAIGSDCPYFKEYQQAAVHWDGGTVTGITGPHKRVYSKT